MFTAHGKLRCAVVAVALGMLSASSRGATGDTDTTGYVDLQDYRFFGSCFVFGGPRASIPEACLEWFDGDSDQNLDLADFAAFQRSLGHLPIPLRDSLGNVVVMDSSTPYSGRRTCAGDCHAHDIDYIANGFKFQQGRTDLDGNIVTKDDYHEDGRWWQQGAGRYGDCSINASMRILASKESVNESQIDLTTFGWIGECGACHVGGGPGEFDRDGQRLYAYYEDTGRFQFGFERLGKTLEDVALDGDYTYMDASGDLQPARWDVTGIVEPDCLFCHTPDPAWNNGANINRRTWRTQTLRAMENLVDNDGSPVPAFAAAGAASQGWFSNLEVEGPAASVLQLDYSVGVDAGTLRRNPDDTISLAPRSVDRPPRDNACWICHGPIGQLVLRGQVWFDPRGVHYAKFNNLSDEDPTNDISPENSKACVYCHPGNLEHNFAKGNSFAKHYRDEIDWVNFRSCRECHLTELANGEPNTLRHPDAPEVPGDVMVHLVSDPDTHSGPFDVISCQGCHVPYVLRSAPQVRAFRDPSLTGTSINYWHDQFYSADPINPLDPDKSRWYPALYPKVDSDGVTRLFPVAGPYLNIYWADWDQRGTPADLSDDLIVPIAIWRLAQITGGQPLPEITDDNGDGKPEINRRAEILAYIQALKGNDSYGRQVAARPVYIKGSLVWYEDSEAPGGVNFFDADAAGVNSDWQGTLLGLDHNVLAKEESWGYSATTPDLGCAQCHRPMDFDSPVFDRLILVDPWDENGQPVYKTVREMTGRNPP